MKKYLFAKSFQQLTQEALMQLCAELGITGPTLLLRNGYWTTEDHPASIPAFVSCANRFGLEVRYADTNICNDGEDAQRLFALLAENGIRQIRLGYLPRPHGVAVRSMADELCTFAEKMCRLAEKNGVQSIIQLHGWFYPQSATAAYPAIKDLDSRYIGIKVDLGNNLSQEGYEFFDYQADLLGEYIAALGAKNAIYTQENGIWTPGFAPCHKGIADYAQVYRELHRVGFDGPTILMPLYTANSVAEYKSLIAEEIRYLDQCAQQ